MPTEPKRSHKTPTRKPGRTPGTRVREARVNYDAKPEQQSPPPVPYGIAHTRLSSKNQMTIPVAYVRALGLKPGDEIDLMMWDGLMIVERHPKNFEEWDAKVGGSMAHVPEWETVEKIDAWIRDGRDHDEWWPPRTENS